jgi:methionine biosynthesis protein MetW
MPSGSFDYVVLSHTLQYCSRPADVLKQAGRIGEHVIVSIKNAGYWRERFRSFAQGQLADWQAPALRSSTIRDFAEFARSLRFGLERATPVTRGNSGAPFAKTLWRANWFAEEAVFLLTP